jgi:RAD51-like protein 2
MTKPSNIPLAHLPLRPTSLQLLRSRGFVTVNEVEDSVRTGGLANLAAELGSTLQAAGGLWQELKLQQQIGSTALDASMQKENQHIKNATLNRPRTAQEILLATGGTGSAPTPPNSIITFCREIDQLLGGGISIGELTDIAGPPGVGKTQWGMQLAVNASLPIWAGGVCGETVYIDTEGSFCPERCDLLATALIHHVQAGLKKRKRGVTFNRTVPDILQGIHVIRVHDQAELAATLEGSLPQLARDRAAAGSPLRLVVVDSIAFPMRAELPPNVVAANGRGETESDFYVARTRQLTVFAMLLAQLAVNYNLAVVTMNQMTTKITAPTRKEAFSSGQLVPALGESWAHAVATRIILSSYETAPGQVRRRTCSLVKSPRLPSGAADYQVLDCGVRGVDYSLRPNGRTNEHK